MDLRIARELVRCQDAPEPFPHVRLRRHRKARRRVAAARNAVEGGDLVRWPAARLEQPDARARLASRHSIVVVHEEHRPLDDYVADAGGLTQIHTAQRPADMAPWSPAASAPDPRLPTRRRTAATVRVRMGTSFSINGQPAIAAGEDTPSAAASYTNGSYAGVHIASATRASI